MTTYSHEPCKILGPALDLLKTPGSCMLSPMKKEKYFWFGNGAIVCGFEELQERFSVSGIKSDFDGKMKATLENRVRATMLKGVSGNRREICQSETSIYFPLNVRRFELRSEFVCTSMDNCLATWYGHSLFSTTV